MKHWRTTIFGIVGVLVSAAFFIALPLLDSDPLSSPDIGGFLLGAATALGLISAADSKALKKQFDELLKKK